jgi:hypothetical protein
MLAIPRPWEATCRPVSIKHRTHTGCMFMHVIDMFTHVIDMLTRASNKSHAIDRENYAAKLIRT